MNRPSIPNGVHPVEQGHYVLPTREVLKLMETLMKTVSNRSPGIIVYGRPRIGKSSSIQFAMRYIPEKLGAPIPIFSTSCNLYRMPSEEKFFLDMLNDFKFPFPSKRKPSNMRSQIVNLLIEQGEKSKLRRVVLIIDEAHRLTELHYNWLIDIYNELDRAKISLTVISVGQEELLSRRTFFLEQKKSQIIGRFMTKEHQFYGIRTIEDIKFCLKCYDQVSEYPEGSGWSFTRYYFPKAFEEGHRLEKCAADLYSLFKDIRREYGLSKSLEIPMEYFAFTVENAMKQGCADDIYWPTQDLWKNAVKDSGYIESEIYMALA
ncbi:ATP-binding protein [Paenibacillus agilis]|uniref:ATP-binding protein n=1 Tax=Paenibacillus agilis TaxID=3020863 RepID=A0A559J065_9BACL|nr:ATP-binding protein [Paenibacillus agilis]TVX93262.1 ATP-binding protein [Paenibacillus agilis]